MAPDSRTGFTKAALEPGQLWPGHELHALLATGSRDARRAGEHAQRLQDERDHPGTLTDCNSRARSGPFGHGRRFAAAGGTRAASCDRSWRLNARRTSNIASRSTISRSGSLDRSSFLRTVTATPSSFRRKRSPQPPMAWVSTISSLRAFGGQCVQGQFSSCRVSVSFIGRSTSRIWALNSLHTATMAVMSRCGRALAVFFLIAGAGCGGGSTNSSHLACSRSVEEAQRPLRHLRQLGGRGLRGVSSAPLPHRDCRWRRGRAARVWRGTGRGLHVPDLRGRR